MRLLLASLTLAASSVVAPAHAANVLVRTTMLYHRQGPGFVVLLDCEAFTVGTVGRTEAALTTAVECHLGGVTTTAVAPGPLVHAAAVNVLVPPFLVCVTGRANVLGMDPVGTQPIAKTVCNTVEHL